MKTIIQTSAAIMAYLLSLPVIVAILYAAYKTAEMFVNNLQTP